MSAERSREPEFPASSAERQNEQVVRLLKSIEVELKGIRAAILASAAAKPAGGKAPAARTTGGGGEVASDRDLDGQYGDPMITKDPPRWKGSSYVSHKFSETEPDYLECLADFYDYKADNPREGKAQYVPRDRREAGRARGWAQRLRKGWGAGNSKPAADSGNAPPADDGADSSDYDF